MIKMVMGDKYGRERVNVKTILLQGFLQTAQTDSRIYQYTSIVGTQIVAVAAAAAGKAHESDHSHSYSAIDGSSSSSARSRARSVPGS